MERTACNLCGADRPRRLYRNFDLDISRCRNCGLVYAGPARLAREETWSRYSDTYFHGEYLPAHGVTGATIDLPLYDAIYARLLGRLAPYRQLGTLIEIGCGAGLFLKAAERAGWTVSGLEVMTAGVRFARERLGLDVIATAAEDADLAEGGYDVVALLEVIEHLSDPRALLRRVAGLLRPGGCLAITTPNVNSLSRWFLGGGWSVLNPGEHLFYFSERTLTAMLSATGYVRVRYDRHYAGAGRYETVMPVHSFTPKSTRARMYRLIVDALGPRALRGIQARGRADGLQCLAERPADR